MVLAVHLYKRLMKKGRVFWLLLLSSVPAGIYWLAGLSVDQRELETLYSSALSAAGYTFSVAALILTVATLRDERDSGTLPYIYMRPLSRLSMAFSSIGAGIAAALTIALGAWAATVVAVLLVGPDLSVVVPGLALFAAAAIGYAALFVPLGYLVPRALLVGLGYIIVIEFILAQAVTGFAQLSIWRIALSIYADAGGKMSEFANEVLGPVEPGVGGGILKIAGTLVVGTAVLTWALKRRDAL